MHDCEAKDLSSEGIISEFISIGERVSKLPANERQHYRKAVSETYHVLDKASQHHKSRKYFEEHKDVLIPIYLPTVTPEFMVLGE